MRGGDGWRILAMDECIAWMWLNECITKIRRRKNEWHPTTKSFQNKYFISSIWK
jgi:hypothetical protein